MDPANFALFGPPTRSDSTGSAPDSEAARPRPTCIGTSDQSCTIPSLLWDRARCVTDPPDGPRAFWPPLCLCLCLCLPGRCPTHVARSLSSVRPSPGWLSRSLHQLSPPAFAHCTFITPWSAFLALLAGHPVAERSARPLAVLLGFFCPWARARCRFTPSEG